MKLCISLHGNALGKSINPSVLPLDMNKVIKLTWFSSFSKATNLKEGKLWIQTSCTLLKNWPCVTSCLLQRGWVCTLDCAFYELIYEFLNKKKCEQGFEFMIRIRCLNIVLLFIHTYIQLSVYQKVSILFICTNVNLYYNYLIKKGNLLWHFLLAMKYSKSENKIISN